MRGIFTWTICPVGPNPIAQPHLNHAPRVPSTRHLFQFKQPLSLHSETLPRLLGLTKSQPHAQIGRPAKSSSLIKFNPQPLFLIGAPKARFIKNKKKFHLRPKKKQIKKETNRTSARELRATAKPWSSRTQWRKPSTHSTITPTTAFVCRPIAGFKTSSGRSTPGRYCALHSVFW